jgi:hypothetical protein
LLNPENAWDAHITVTGLYMIKATKWSSWMKRELLLSEKQLPERLQRQQALNHVSLSLPEDSLYDTLAKERAMRAHCTSDDETVLECAACLQYPPVG